MGQGKLSLQPCSASACLASRSARDELCEHVSLRLFACSSAVESWPALAVAARSVKCNPGRDHGLLGTRNGEAGWQSGYRAKQRALHHLRQRQSGVLTVHGEPDSPINVIQIRGSSETAPADLGHLHRRFSHTNASCVWVSRNPTEAREAEMEHEHRKAARNERSRSCSRHAKRR